MKDFQKLTRRWNLVVAPLVRDYLDPAVSAEQWLSDSRPIVGDLRSVVSGMNRVTATIHDPRIRKVVRDFWMLYREQLDALVALQHAVANGDESAQVGAQAQLRSATDRKTEAALSLLHALPAEARRGFDEELSERSVEIERLLRPSPAGPP